MRRGNGEQQPDILTPREWEVLALLRDGLTNEQIGERLGISFDGAKYHVAEIISRLGVGSRQEAAAWRPAADQGEARSTGILAPLAAMRRISPRALATPAGVAAMVVVAIAVGALAWGVMATRGSASSAWSYDDAASTGASVMVFDLTNREARRLPIADNASVARWLRQGETFVAHGDAVDDYPIYGLDGKKIITPITQGRLTSEVVPAPDGSAVLVGRTDNQYLVSEIPPAVGSGSTFLSSARDLSFSGDGRMAWVSVGGNDKDNVVHDFRTVYVTQHSTLTGYAGGGMAIFSQREADGVIDLAQDPWSSEGKYLLTLAWPACGAPICQGPPVYEVYGTDSSFKSVWKRYVG